jgi:hypothetical protein
VAAGWDIQDFGSPWPRGAIPADADPSELIVGFLDAERAAGEEWSCEQLNGQAAPVAPGTPPLTVTPAQLAEIRARRRDLVEQWERVAPGETLVLTFDPDLFK